MLPRGCGGKGRPRSPRVMMSGVGVPRVPRVPRRASGRATGMRGRHFRHRGPFRTRPPRIARGGNEGTAGSRTNACVSSQSFSVGSERSLTVPSSSSRISRPSERAPRKALWAEGRAKRVRDARLTRGRASGASGSPAEPRAGRAARSRDRPNRESRPPVRESQRLARARGDVGGGGAPDGGGRSARRHVHGRRRASPAEGGRG